MCDCYLVQFSIHTSIAQHILGYGELGDLFSPILNTFLLLDTFVVTVYCVTVIQFNSPTYTAIARQFEVTVNCVMVISFNSQYILLLLD